MYCQEANAAKSVYLLADSPALLTITMETLA
jgi:hypothetical protein